MIQEVTKLKTSHPQSGAASASSLSEPVTVPTFDLPADNPRARMDVYVTWYVQKYLVWIYNQYPKETKTFAHGWHQPSQYYISQFKSKYLGLKQDAAHEPECSHVC